MKALSAIPIFLSYVTKNKSNVLIINTIDSNTRTFLHEKLSYMNLSVNAIKKRLILKALHTQNCFHEIPNIFSQLIT